MYRLYQSWIGTSHAAPRTEISRFAKDAADVRHYALLLCSELETMISGLQCRAGKVTNSSPDWAESGNPVVSEATQLKKN